MEQLQKILSEVWGEWTVEEKLGEGTFGKVYKIKREFLGREQFAALKAIRISQNKTSNGFTFSMDDKSFVDEIVSEIELMAKIKGNSNIVSYEDHKVIEDGDGMGWTILIRMELLTPLSDYIESHEVSEETVTKLGTDISRALVILGKNNIIHRDIKLENIFVSENGDFKLGDFGTARIIEKTVDNRTKTGTYMYMAPEVIKSEPYGAKADIYSLGILMYYLLNHNRFPFFPAYPEPVNFSDSKEAFNKRVAGQAVPPIECKDRKLLSVVMKACEFDSKNRFANAHEMNLALENLNPQKTVVIAEDYPVKKPEKKKKLLFAAILSAVVLITVIAVFFASNSDFAANNETGQYAEEDEQTEGNLKYKVFADGVHITGMVEACDNLEIPGEIKGKPVVAIDPQAFANSSILTAKLPGTTEVIGDCAFINCLNLNSIILPEGLKTIGERAFEKCSSLVTVELPQSLETIGNFAFKDCILLCDISVPDGLRNAGTDAFAYTPYFKNRKDMFGDYSHYLSHYSDSKYTLLDIDSNGVEEILIFGAAKDETSFFGKTHKYMLAVFDFEYGVTGVLSEIDSKKHESAFGNSDFSVLPIVSTLGNIYNDYDKLYHSASDGCLYGCVYNDGFEEIYKISLVDGIYKQELYQESSYVGENPTVLGEEVVFTADVADPSLLDEVIFRGIVETEITEE